MDLKKHIGKKIKDLRARRGMNQDELAEILGTTKQTVSRYEKGDRQANQDILFQLSKVFNVDVDFFFPGHNLYDSVIKETKSDYTYYSKSISAGIPQLVEGVESADQLNIPDSIMGKWAGDESIYMMKINGESMNKIIPHGSIIAIKPTECHLLKDGDIVVYSDNHDYSVKRYYKDGDRLIFRPDSTDGRFYDYITSTDNDNLMIHGKVVVYIVELS